MIDDFIYLSRILTGEDELDFVLAEQYLQRLLNESKTPADLQTTLERVRQIREAGGTSDDIVRAVREQIVTDATLKTTAQRIIFLWYTGSVKNGTNLRYGSAEQYFSGLFWKVVRAHPPALSGGYYGYWKYPPEN